MQPHNYRMSPIVALRGIRLLEEADDLLSRRSMAASMYRAATSEADWITEQYQPSGSGHSHWTYAVALESADLWHPFVDSVEAHGGERPYAAWRLTYQEPAFRHLAPDGTCPVAEDLQPRLIQFQTNDVEQAKRNAEAVAGAIRGLGG